MGIINIGDKVVIEYLKFDDTTIDENCHVIGILTKMHPYEPYCEVNGIGRRLAGEGFTSRMHKLDK
jgi:hypothetical protein